MPFFKRDLVSLFYTTHGVHSGVPILLLHGWACDAHDWSHQIPLLASLGLRVIALDHRGHGKSSAPPAISDYSMRTMAEDAVALLQYLQASPAIIMAHSMSTIIASILAVEHPQMVKALVLAHPIYCGVPPSITPMTEAMRKDPSIAPDMIANFFSDFMYTPETPEWLKTWHIRRVLGTDPVALTGCAQAIVDLVGSVIGKTADAKAFMNKRVIPKLVIATSALPAALAWEEDLERGQSDMICSIDGGTFSHFVHTGRFNEILQAWLVDTGLAMREV